MTILGASEEVEPKPLSFEPIDSVCFKDHTS
jgi:hypothetical protein